MHTFNIRFGTENRGKNISNNNPGPGQYKNK